MKKVILFALVFMASITIVNAGTPVVTEKKTETTQIVIKGKVLDKNGELTDETLGDYGKHRVWEKIKDYKLKIELNK
ncbi:MAG: hypothetical protein WCQ47_08570 [bacterium]